MSNRLKKLHLYTVSTYPDMIGIALLIVKHLPHLQVIELHFHRREFFETLLILMNGLPKLNFIICHAILEGENRQHSKMHDLLEYSTRACRIEYCNLCDSEPMLFVWL